MAASFGNLPKKGETVRGGKVISNWDPNGFKRAKKAELNKYWSEQGWRKLTDPATGKDYKVPADDYQEFSTWESVNRQGTDTEEGMEEYIAKGFKGNKDSFSVEGCGHIKFLEYDGYRMLLRVTFWNDDVCVYFRVPLAVAGQLRVYALSRQTQLSAIDNKARHLLGIRFWDLVRIRGTIHGSRYRFTYASIGNNTSQASNEPDWSTGKYVFVPNSQGKYVLKDKDSLTEAEREDLEDSIYFASSAQPLNAADKALSIKEMYNKVKQANITQAQRDAVIRKLDTMKDNEEAMRNFLGIIGLF